MTGLSKNNLPEDGDIEISAPRHIGPTLESDPEYREIPRPEYSMPEAQIAAEAARTDPDRRDLLDEDEEIDLLSGRESDVARPEPLKNRLPGDTSSDPHTDVGRDNATTVQNRKKARTELREFTNA